MCCINATLEWTNRIGGDLDNLHEVRDRQGEMLYRLFVLWQRKERRVVVVDGRKKPNRTVISEHDYKAVASLVAAVATDPPPFASADDFIQADLKN